MVTKDNKQALLKLAGVTYPRVTNIANGSLRDKVNRTIKKTAFKAVPDYNPGTSISNADSGYSTMVNQNDILSLKFECYYYPEMAAHGVTGVSSATLDLRTGHVYRFNELFRRDSNYQAVINQLIQEQIVAGQIPLLKPFEGVGDDADYYLTPDSLVIYYQPYVYTPGSFGVLEFRIPYGRIKEIIDPRGPIGKVLGLS